MVRLFIPFYKEKNLQRRAELDYALKMNIKFAPVDEIYMVCENGAETEDLYLLKSDKLIIIDVGKRQTFKSMFEMANDITEDGDINLFCNSDIFITGTFSPVFDYIKPNNFLALTRWDLNNTGEMKLFQVNYSQDLWGYRGKLKHMDKLEIDIFCGIIGCDNALAAEITKIGYQIINPAHTIPSIHVHWSAIRNYTSEVRCAGDYLWFTSHKLGENPVFEKRFCPDDWKKGSGPDFL